MSDDYRHFITTTLEKASAIARNYFGKVTATTKPGDNNQVLTEADLAIGRFIIKQIQQRFPDHNIIDEEAGMIDNHSRFTWVIDPIDGTSNFAAGVPTYGIFLGLLNTIQPIAGGAALPYFSDILIAAKGQGATKNGQAIHVSQETKLSNTLVAYGIDSKVDDPSFVAQEGKLIAGVAQQIRNLRSSYCAFDLSMTAQGKYGAYLGRGSKIWDNVAAEIIISEAGGTYTDFMGNPTNYEKRLNDITLSMPFCAAPPTLHQQLQTIIHHQATS